MKMENLYLRGEVSWKKKTNMARRRKNYKELSYPEKRREFKSHFLTYLVISVFLIALNLITSPHHPWFQWPILGWGLAVAMQGIELVVSRDKEMEEGRLQRPLPPQETPAMPSTQEEDALELPELEKRWTEDDLV